MSKLSCLILVLTSLLIYSEASLYIYHGHMAKLGEIPYQAFLLDFNNKRLCSGALIDTKWVLTAAHCFRGTSKLIVQLGGVEPAIMRYYHSKVFISHPGYNPDTFLNDIGLIKLPDSVVRWHIAPVPMVSNNMESLDGWIIQASGFGATENGYFSTVLKVATLKTISKEKCLQYFDAKHIQENTLCTVGANDPEEGTCFGDSGGPLTINQNGQDVLVAIIGNGDCNTHAPTLNTRVSPYRDWIQQTINNGGMSSVVVSSVLLIPAVVLLFFC